MEAKTLSQGSTVSLSIPADRSMMLVARLTSAAVLARAGISADQLDEMKMAVEEALTCLLQGGGISAVRLNFVRVQGGLSIELAGVADSAALPAVVFPEEERTVIRCILETMADEVEIHEVDGAIRSIELLARIPS